jgi:ABC-2 type transport system permease protein
MSELQLNAECGKRSAERQTFPTPLSALRTTPRSPYLALALSAWQRALAYRTGYLLNLLTGLVWVAALFALWRAIYAEAPGQQVGAFDWPTMRTYLVVSYAVNALHSYSSSARLVYLIRNGGIATELLRPVDYLRAQLAQSLGAALLEGALGAGLALLMGALVLGVEQPVSLWAAALFLLSVGLGFLIKFLLNYITALGAFWTVEGTGLIWAQMAILNLCSGALLPLTLFPGWLQHILLALPFQGIVYTPLAIYLGRLTGQALAQALGLQLVWLCVLWWLARLLWRPAARALEVQGG